MTFPLTPVPQNLLVKRWDARNKRVRNTCFCYSRLCALTSFQIINCSLNRSLITIVLACYFIILNLLNFYHSLQKHLLFVCGKAYFARSLFYRAISCVNPTRRLGTNFDSVRQNVCDDLLRFPNLITLKIQIFVEFGSLEQGLYLHTWKRLATAPCPMSQGIISYR